MKKSDYTVKPDTNSTSVTFGFLPSKNVKRLVVEEACKLVWDRCVRYCELELVGRLDEMTHPGYDSYVTVTLVYETVKDLVQYHASDKRELNEAFAEEVISGMARYFERALTQMVFDDLDEHACVTGLNPDYEVTSASVMGELNNLDNRLREELTREELTEVSTF